MLVVVLRVLLRVPILEPVSDDPTERYSSSLQQSKYAGKDQLEGFLSTMCPSTLTVHPFVCLDRFQASESAMTHFVGDRESPNNPYAIPRAYFPSGFVEGTRHLRELDTLRIDRH